MDGSRKPTLEAHCATHKMLAGVGYGDLGASAGPQVSSAQIKVAELRARQGEALRILNRTLAKLGEPPRKLDEFDSRGDWRGGIDREMDAAMNRLTQAEAAKHFEAGRQQQRDQSIEPVSLKAHVAKKRLERDLAARLEAMTAA